MSPGGNGYNAWILNKYLRNLIAEGYMRGMQWQLGVLGTISAFALDIEKLRKKPMSKWPVEGPTDNNF
jgi:hypothetical protein